MEKEFNLSEKRYEGSEIVAMTFKGLYKEEDVKEFIKQLLNSTWLNKGMKRTILRFAGGKLNGKRMERISGTYFLEEDVKKYIQELEKELKEEFIKKFELSNVKNNKYFEFLMKIEEKFKKHFGDLR